MNNTLFKVKVFLLLLISIGFTQAQTNSQIIKQLYDDAFGVVEQAEDLTTIAVQAVWTASTLTSTATFTGTLTQSTSNHDFWTYSTTPNNKLIVHFSNNSEIYFTFTSFDGYIPVFRHTQQKRCKLLLYKG